jgi:hypothetical protein
MSAEAQERRARIKAELEAFYVGVTTVEVCLLTCRDCRVRSHSHCYPKVYADLRALERQGEVAREVRHDQRGRYVLWFLVEEVAA